MPYGGKKTRGRRGAKFPKQPPYSPKTDYAGSMDSRPSNADLNQTFGKKSSPKREK